MVGQGHGSMRAADLARVAEAAAALTLACLIRRTLPTARWHRLLGHPVPASPGTPWTHPAVGGEGAVAESLARGSRRLPWTPDCLDQALAAQLMLRRRGTPGVAVIGLKPGSTWQAHAWLVGASGTVVGGPVSEGFAPVSAFAPQGARGTA